jgi:hypothetical protein
METVDYLKLSEQYANFLVAIGSVSITVLTLVLSLGSDSVRTKGVYLRSYLVAALIVAALACFIGAHMMAETASFIEFHQKPHSSTGKETSSSIELHYSAQTQTDEERASLTEPHLMPPPPTGDRLFLFASINIFIGITLVLFASMLLPTSSGRVLVASLAPISVGVFLLIVFCLVYWMILAAEFRMPVPHSGWAIWPAIVIAVLSILLLCRLNIPQKYMLLITFAPSALTVVISLVWFAWIFREGDTSRLHNARLPDIIFFSFAVTISYSTLIVAGIKIMLGKEIAAYYEKHLKKRIKQKVLN